MPGGPTRPRRARRQRPHYVSLHLGGSTGAELFKGTIFNGIESRTYDVPAIDAGQYAFVCTVHPTMIGTLNAQ